MTPQIFPAGMSRSPNLWEHLESNGRYIVFSPVVIDQTKLASQAFTAMDEGYRE
jgi:hypothetical protein